MTTAAPTAGKTPPQIPFIIGNEACERFSFYGMKNILTLFLATTFFAYLPTEDARNSEAKTIYHTFIMGVYFFPLLGGFISDRIWGKYKTIFLLSIVYCVGHACLAIFEHDKNGFYLGLGLIALGAGGIKPLVASFVGDQFDETNKEGAKRVFEMFYWSINFGSFTATLLVPWLLKNHGAAWAFGIPGVLMLVATVIFWAGRRRYVHVPPIGFGTRRGPEATEAGTPTVDGRNHTFSAVCTAAILRHIPSMVIVGVGLVLSTIVAVFSGLPPAQLICLVLVILLLAVGIGASLGLPKLTHSHPAEALEAVRGVLRVLIVFSLVTPFWSLFDQKGSTWVIQARAMTKPDWFSPAYMMVINPALIMILIPLNTYVVMPALRRRGVNLHPLRLMTWGMILVGISFVIVGVIQNIMDAGTKVSIVWQVIPYIFLSLGEVLVSTVGLEFAYSQAPPSMKGIIMSFWNLAVTVGNLWVLLTEFTITDRHIVKSTINDQGYTVVCVMMFFFALFAFVAALGFKLYARRYKVVEHYRKA